MFRNRTLVIATRNKGKTAEIRDLLNAFPVAIKDLDDFGPIPEVLEDGDTFDENAYKKASFTARVLGYPALADDSGLVVAALNGAPGVQSARWAGPDATDAERGKKLLLELENQANRSAAFECVISIAVPGGPALTYEGRCEGTITHTPVGANGFGYDPVFFYPPLNKTFAQLTMAEKSRVSHRGRALQVFRDEFDKVMKWIDRHMPEPEISDCQSQRGDT
ncbi:MAG: XTP/dITP diphosphatase [Desulfobacteraceae bacterium]|jgi:XTP/dITP diphosphohydrolase|nr:XTP/dITP diphosphatase [Desulfobacteraceae bacterium]